MHRAAYLVVLALVAVTTAAPPSAPLTRDEQAIVSAVSPAEMKGNLSFLASDLLQGRGTPSPGLDLAAEFIASRFRAAGLEPAGDDGYFQTADWPLRGDAPKTAKVRNVIGVLRGSDPKLKDTYVMVTAHYDHLGMKKSVEGDLIYNGANDDGSGTVGVIALAEAMAKLKPRRTIIFMALFGEERGLLGSRYYGEHPLFPVEKTIADINLEQIGRTDDTEGPRVKELSMTGFDYSDIGPMLDKAGAKVGVRVTKHPQFSDAYFGRSDNQSLADQGVPAHTVCTAFEYPDYHRVSDHWDKVDYENLALVTRAAGLGIWQLANSDREPKWNSANPKAARYLAAWNKRHGVSN